MSPRRSLALALLVAACRTTQALPVDTAEARRQVQSLLPRGQQLVTSGGLPYVYLHDLDGDAQPEVFALTVAASGASGVGTEELARYGRLFEPEGAEAEFRTLVFADRAGILSLARTVELGRWRVLAAMDFRRLSRDSSAPFALTYVFQTVDGAEHVWVVVARDPRAEPAVASFRETISSDVAAIDVDGDGMLDVVTAERQIERTSIRETYLTWHRWSGNEFREHASTVIVRNLVQFLADTRTKLLAGEYARVVDDALEPASIQRLRRSGLDPVEILDRFFPVALEISGIRDLALPEIRESPFRLPSEAPPPVTLDVRLVDSSGAVRFTSIAVAIARNPFVKRQYSLLPTEPQAPGSS